MNKLDLTVIIPVHSVADPNFNVYLERALNSIKNNPVHPELILIVRCPCGDVSEELAKYDGKNYGAPIYVLENNTGKAFHTQMNFAIQNVSTKYFSFLEFDDEYSNTYLKNVDTYSQAFPDVNMFLPIITDVDADDKMLGYTNEAVWAMNLTNVVGELDNETLLEFNNINPDGMVVNTEAFKAAGGYKSIKLTFNYEMLLRFSNLGNRIMVIPKIGYKHVNMRPGGLFDSYKNSEDSKIKLSPEEAKFWMDVAKKEYFYTEDREITYAKVEAV